VLNDIKVPNLLKTIMGQPLWIFVTEKIFLSVFVHKKKVCYKTVFIFFLL